MKCIPPLKTFAAALVSLSLPSCDRKDQADYPQHGPDPRSPLGESSHNLRPRTFDYTVKKGDSLNAIAKRFGVDVAEIAQNNRLTDPYIIYPGQKLHLGIPLPRLPDDNQPHSSDPSTARPARPAHRDQSLNQYEIHGRPDSVARLESLPLPELYKEVRKGGEFPFLRLGAMPPEARPYLTAMSQAIATYAEHKGLDRSGPPYCGQGVCNAFLSIRNSLVVDGREWKISRTDAIFTDKEFYRSVYGTPSRDAYKIRKILLWLSSREDSGWVRIALGDLPHTYDYVNNKKYEGKMYKPTGVPDGALLLYDPHPTKVGLGGGGEANGHVEWTTSGADGERLYVFTARTPVHGGSPFCRRQFSAQIAGKGIRCYAFVLVPPEIKALWLSYQQRKLAGE